METFSALLAFCAGNSPVAGEFTAERPVTRSFDIFFDLCLNKCLSKQSWGWRFKTPSCPLWRHRNAYSKISLWNVKLSSKLTHHGELCGLYWEFKGPWGTLNTVGFHQEYSQQTLCSWPMKASYGMYFVSLQINLWSAVVIAVMEVISWYYTYNIMIYIGLCYNNTWL